MRLPRISGLVPALAALLVLSACGSGDEGNVDENIGQGEGDSVGEEVGQPQGSHPYEKHFEAAGEEFDVPAKLLMAIGWVETRLYHVPGAEAEIDGIAPAYGVMALRGEAVEKGAALAGLSVDEVQDEPLANIRAAAALLDAQAEEQGIDRDDIEAWAPVVAAYMGHPSLEVQSAYVHDEVYRVLREGIPAAEDSGRPDLIFANPELVAKFPIVLPYSNGYVPKARYAAAKWRPAPTSNYTSGRSSSISLLVVHTCAGSYSSCWGWLTTPYPTNPYKTSVHYVVNESGSEVSMLVDEIDTAHHVGAKFNGLPTNPRSVGIEHGGFPYSGANKWTEGQIATSAKLACDVVKRQKIIRDRNHIIGHYQPDPVNRPNDPGKDFPWADYMSRIEKCVTGDAGGGGGGTITVDSNNANNNASVARMVPPSANWKASSNVSNYYGSGYWVAPTAAVSDGAHFEFYLPAAAQKTVYAWWTAAGDRSTATPFVAFDANGNKLGSVNKNQQANGGSWQKLGTYNFTKGWNRITVSRWAAAGKQVVADAIKVQ